MPHSQNTTPIVIEPNDLPLYCNGSAAQTQVWNGHPRVFLPIQSYGQIECPYCGTIYQLDGERDQHHSPVSGSHHE